MSPYSQSIEQNGFAIISNVVEDGTISALINALDQAGSQKGVRRRESVYAIRSLLEAVPQVAALAAAPAIRALLTPLLGPDCFAVRGILFDKTPDANWNVVWHQDMTIAVCEKKEMSGFGPWSKKAGVVHVQPPVQILERMLTVRLHLDDCGDTNGPLQVLPGSHRDGRLTPADIQQRRREMTPFACLVPAGGALLMRPLLLHASSASQSPCHRRVIHLDYAAQELPGTLRWQVETTLMRG